MSNTTRNDVKQLAQQIETLAKEVQSKLDTGGDFLSTANELVRNNVTFVFALGEVYALEQVGTKKTVRATTVSNPSGTSRNYHNVRDSRGRFSSKV
jgi:hypothetical protein